MNELSLICQALRRPDRFPAVLGTLVSVSGSSYRRPGARILISADGRRTGAISGGCLEEDVIARAHRVLASGEPELLRYDTSAENDQLWGVGLGCHGIVHVLLERIVEAPAWSAVLDRNRLERRPTQLVVTWASDQPEALGTRLADDHAENARGTLQTFRETVEPTTLLAVFGAGDDAQPLVRIATELGWETLVADPRPAFATAERFPEAARVLVIRPDQSLAAQGLIFDAHTVAVVMTHHYVHDVPLLRQLLPLALPYLGLLGPKGRAERILAELGGADGALSSAPRPRLHAPVGLDIGAATPEAVALSIAAEIQTTLAGRDGRPLRDRTRPIHG